MTWLERRIARARELARRKPGQWRAPHYAAAALVVALIGALGYFDAWLYSCGFEGCPSGREIRAFRAPEGGRVLDRGGRTLGVLNPVRRVNVELATVPKHVRDAFVAVEDRRFHRHRGTDWVGAVRATFRNVRSLGVREGFSTITMQVARNTFVARQYSERSLRKKVIELRVARLLEHHLPKDRLLELYMNVIYFGNGVYGVEAASRDLFGKPVRQVDVAEAAMLAALPKGPSLYTPRRHPKRARARRDLVLAIMAREGYLDPVRARQLAATPVRVARNEWRPVRPDASFAMDLVRVAVDSLLEDLGVEVEPGTITVATTIDVVAQRAAERTVTEHAARIERQAEAGAANGNEVQGAMVAIDPRSGAMRAVVGGRRYQALGFNRAVAAKRQPGSTFKPFVYAAALAAGYTTASLLEDEPIQIERDGELWEPGNFEGTYLGRVTMRTALARSANAATIRLSQAVGEERVVEYAKRQGIVSPLRPVPAIALGAIEVTPLELVTAYSPFANGGERVAPWLIREIRSNDGRVLYTAEPSPRQRVLAAEDAWLLTSMLRSVVERGSGRAVRDYGVTGPVAGKTGTSNDGTDVWFIGYTPTVVAGFWFGYDRPRPLPGQTTSGGRVAAPAWAEFYQRGWRERAPDSAWAPPATLVKRRIDVETGDLAGQWCPITSDDWFKPGSEPTRVCTHHVEPNDDPWWYPSEIGDAIKSGVGRIFGGKREPEGRQPAPPPPGRPRR